MIQRYVPLLLLLLLGNALSASNKILPLSELKPGMRGVGRTVFAGTEIEEFEFEILEIIPNFRAKRDLILVKLLGEKVEHTGVVAGMSGSPMYVDGRLIGALSYRFGLFVKEPIAGVTPIEQMLEILEHEEVRDQELAFRRGFNRDYLEVAVGVQPFSWETFVPPQLRRAKTVRAQGANVAPLDIPMLLSGFEAQSLDLTRSLFDGLGFEVLSVGGSVSSTPAAEPVTLEPGDAFSVILVDGDFGLQATGTVTYRDQDHIIGFGHPFLDFGAVTMPMGKAKILTTLSSLMASTKIGAVTQEVGTVHQDRTTGVMGVSGEQARMIPFRVRFRSTLADETSFDFRVVEDRSLYSFTPLIFGLVLANAIESARLSVGSQTLKLNGVIELEGREPIRLQNYYAGQGVFSFVTDAAEAVGEVASTLGTVLANDFESPQIKKVELNFEASHRSALVEVKRISVDRTILRPGDTVNVTVHLKEFQGKAYTVKHALEIPAHIKGTRLTLYAGSGRRLTQIEARTTPQKFRPQTFEQLVELLHNRRENNAVFFQLRQRDRGVFAEGEELPSLPPSILSVMNAQRATGKVASLRQRVLTEEEVPVDFAVTGGRTLTLKLKPKDE